MTGVNRAVPHGREEPGKRTSTVTGQIRRVAFVVVVTAALGACGFFQNTLFEDSFWASSPLRQNDEAELGIAELAKGNYVTAEGHFQRALKRNPKDIHALLGAGILYHNTGQLTKAREMYEAVLAIRPDESQQFVVWSNISTRPASQIASVNLSLLDSGGVTSALGSGTPGQESAFSNEAQASGVPEGMHPRAPTITITITVTP